MKLKLDENLGTRGAEMLRKDGHDVSTVPEQGMQVASDRRLIEACRQEGLCIVSLDLDFANPLVFRPSAYHGIAVLRLPARPTPDDLHDAVRTLIGGLGRESVEGKLWIIQRGRIRVYQEEDLNG